jgi:hypothetical protein
MNVGGQGLPAPDPSTARQTTPNGGQAQPPASASLRDRFAPGTLGGAVASIGAQVGGTALDYAKSKLSDNYVASVLGQQFGYQYGGDPRSYMLKPQGAIAANLGDYYQQQMILANQAAVTPGTPTYAREMGQQNLAQYLVPGTTAAGAAGMRANLTAGRNLQSALAFGINLRPNGQYIGQTQSYEAVINKTLRPGATFSQEEMQLSLAGGPLGANAASILGIQPGTPEFEQFQQYVLNRNTWTQQHPGQPVPQGDAAIKAFGLDKSAFAANLQQKSAKTTTESNLMPALTDAVKKWNDVGTSIQKFLSGLTGSKTGQSWTYYLTHPFATIGSAPPAVKAPAASGAAAPIAATKSALITPIVPTAGAGAGATGAGTAVSLGAGAATPHTATLMSLTTSTAGPGDPFGTLSKGPSALPGAVGFMSATSAAPSTSGTGSGTGGSTSTAATPGIATGGAGAPNKEDYMDMVAALYAVGFRGEALQHMVAISTRESAGNPSSHNPNASTGDDSWGWFQINYFKNLLTSRTATYGSPQTLISSPMNQARAAWIMSNKGTKWTDWSTNAGLSQAAWSEAQALISKAQGLGLLTGTGPTDYSRAGLATGSYNVAKSQLYMLHAGERVIPAADNFTVAGRYQRLDSNGSGRGTNVNLHFHPQSIQLVVPPGSSDKDMEKIANRFVAALAKPQILQNVRAS